MNRLFWEGEDLLQRQTDNECFHGRCHANHYHKLYTGRLENIKRSVSSAIANHNCSREAWSVFILLTARGSWDIIAPQQVVIHHGFLDVNAHNRNLSSGFGPWYLYAGTALVRNLWYMARKLLVWGHKWYGWETRLEMQTDRTSYRRLCSIIGTEQDCAGCGCHFSTIGLIICYGRGHFLGNQFTTNQDIDGVGCCFSSKTARTNNRREWTAPKENRRAYNGFPECCIERIVFRR